jgi:hypothetical protein
VLYVVQVMDDVLSQDRGGGPGRRARILAAVVVLIVLAVVNAGRFTDARDTDARDTNARDTVVHHQVVITTGPVQLAGLGSGAARLLDRAGRHHRIRAMPRRRGN